MKTHQNSFFRAAALAVGIFIAHSAFATKITGTIDFTGPLTLGNNGGPVTLGNATKVVSWGGVGGNQAIVSQATGDLNTVAIVTQAENFASPSAATLATNWSFNSGAINPFWQVGGFTFQLTSSSVNSQTNTFLDVSGSGFITGNNFESTPGTWTFNITNQSSAFSFQSATASVPDGGASLALLGMGLIALEGLRRRMKSTR